MIMRRGKMGLREDETKTTGHALHKKESAHWGCGCGRDLHSLLVSVVYNGCALLSGTFCLDVKVLLKHTSKTVPLQARHFRR